MRLVSLGGLRLEGEKFRREKPLLLLTYLALEGPKPRRFLAGLLWPEKDAPLNNFAVALDHLRKFGVAGADGSRVWAQVDCDALDLREHLRAGRIPDALGVYQGAFADGLSGHDLGEELEEWLLGTRENLARELRTALLRHAEDEARLSRFAPAARHAEIAYRLPGSPALEPEELPRFHRVLRAAEHPLSRAIEREAAELGLPLDGPEVPGTAEPVRVELAPVGPGHGGVTVPFVGRESELEHLLSVGAGQWAWVQGGSGLGKTALLHELARRAGALVWPARAGLPYATLAPLLGDIGDSPTDLLRRLSQHTGPLLLDDWEDMDAESQALLTRLHGLKPAFPVVLAGTGTPPLPAAVRVELGPLGAGDLHAHPDALHATAGLPALVGAFLRGEDPQDALHTRLAHLSELARQVYAALALLPSPDLSVIRRALNLAPQDLVRAYEQLMNASLIEPGCEVRGPALAARYLHSEPTLTQQVSLKLARTLPVEGALPLYQRSRAIWEDHDLHRVQEAFRGWAGELLRRGLPKQAAESIQDAPFSPELALLRARALERSNAFKAALDALHGLPDTPDTLALKSRLLFKLGYPDRARVAAEAALHAPETLEAEAEALNTLGEIALRGGDAQVAIPLFSRSATLWQAAGEKSRWLWTLNNRALARETAGQPAQVVFQEVLDAAQDDPSVQASVWNNIGNSHARRREVEQAQLMYERAIRVGTDAAALTPVILAWNGIGVMLHGSSPAQAGAAYRQGLKVCEGTGDAQLTAILLANLAELSGDIPAWEQAIELLKRGGFAIMAAEFQEDLKSFMNR